MRQKVRLPLRFSTGVVGAFQVIETSQGVVGTGSTPTTSCPSWARHPAETVSTYPPPENADSQSAHLSLVALKPEIVILNDCPPPFTAYMATTVHDATYVSFPLSARSQRPKLEL